MATREGQQVDTLPVQLYVHDGAAPVRVGASDLPTWDTATPTFNATSDVWLFTKSAETVATITITYTDATKAVLQSVTKVIA